MKANPSPLGGTYAFLHVNSKGVVTRQESGIILPRDSGLPKISNNFSELFAALEALESIPQGWDGTLYTDSLVTLRRITTGSKFNGIPEPMIERTLRLRKGRRYKVVLLCGHPTRKELEAGVGKRGYPVSIHNVTCDKLCRKEMDAFLEKMKIPRRSA